MNYTYLHIFYTVAKLQNISKAANELGVSQPAVSRIISNIEKEYKTKLFFRGKTGVTLTTEGKHLFEMIKAPLIELEKISENIIDNKALDKITIHIGATSTALYCYLFSHLEKMKELFPNVNFRIHSNSSTKLLEMVNEGSIDFAFTTTPFENKGDLNIYNVAKLNDILIAPISYKEKIGTKMKLKDLEKYPTILLSKEMQFREYIDEFLDKYNVHLNPVYEADSSALLTSFVELGYGLTFIPDEMAQEALSSNKCYKVEIKENYPPRFIVFAIKKDRVHNSIIEQIKNEILEK